jgi:hypothetical protein
MIARPVLLLSLATAFASDPPASSAFLVARSGFQASARKAPLAPAAADSARAKLTELLRAEIGPVQVAGFAGPGEAILTGLDGNGPDRLDALRFGDSAHALLVTTRAVFESFLAARKELPKVIPKSAQANALYALSLSEGEAFANFVRILPGRQPGIDFSLGSVGAFAKEFRDQMPDRVIVFAQVGDRIYLAETSANPVPERIPSCDEAWGTGPAKSAGESKVQLRRYQDCVRDHVGKGENLVAWKAQVLEVLGKIAGAK